MGVTRLRYQPKDSAFGTTYNNVDLGTHPVLFRYQGFIDGTAFKNITVGGRALSISNDAFHRFGIEFQRIDASADEELLTDLQAFWSHALVGGFFEFSLDTARQGNSTINANITQGTKTFNLVSSTGFAAGEVVFIEHVDDPTVFERNVIDSMGTPPQVTLKYGVRYDFDLGSVFRAANFLPKCMILDNRTPLREREGGQGGEIWDFRTTIRTVRN